MGYKCMFAAVDWNYTQTELDGVDGSIAARTLAPRFGLQKPNAAVWIGGFYMNVDKELTSTVAVGGIPVRIETDLNVVTDWNFIYGARWAPNKNLELIVEHGFSGRNQVVCAAAVRF